jgi:hypothetical protein
MAFKQRTIDERMHLQLERFLRTGRERAFFSSPSRKQLESHIDAWLPKMRAALDPAEVSADFKARNAPHALVFERTHELVSIFALLFDAWGRATDKEVAVESAAGPLLVGDDEESDAAKLHAWSTAFAKLFPHTALPPALQPDAVKKQLAAHAHAHAALPGSTQGQIFRAARANLVALRTEGYDYWKRMHDLLDGEYGTAPGAFTIKSELGYDRRLRGAGANRRKRGGDPGPIVPVPAEPGHNGAEKQAGAT